MEKGIEIEVTASHRYTFAIRMAISGYILYIYIYIYPYHVIVRLIKARSVSTGAEFSAIPATPRKGVWVWIA